MIKSLSQIEVNIENKICRFIVDHDTPLGHAKEAIFQITKILAQIEENARVQAEQKQKENQADESPKE